MNTKQLIELEDTIQDVTEELWKIYEDGKSVGFQIVSPKENPHEADTWCAKFWEEGYKHGQYTGFISRMSKAIAEEETKTPGEFTALQQQVKKLIEG